VVNLRYHIVSITAVFLALGIGLTLGSSFLDRVTVDRLESQLQDVEGRVARTNAENEALGRRVDAFERRDEDLATEIPERLLAGRLEAVPVLVIAAEGTNEELVGQTVGALSSAGADVAGTWWLTDRWLLDDPGEVDELGTLLDLSSDDADRLRRNTAIRIAELLETAAQPAAVPADPPVDPALQPTEVPAASEPLLIAALEDAGFIDYTALPGGGDERVLLPGAGARYVVVSGAQPATGPALFATALIDEVVADGVAPVVAAQGEVDVRDAEDQPAPEDERRTTFVGPVREGELTRDRVSTVDDLDTAAGLMATVLAVEDLGGLRTGHYGVATGAARLLPGPDADT
jgi:hypothetical protein